MVSSRWTLAGWVTQSFTGFELPAVPQGRKTIAQCVSTGNQHPLCFQSRRDGRTSTIALKVSCKEGSRSFVPAGLGSLCGEIPVLTHWAILCRPCGTGGGTAFAGRTALLYHLPELTHHRLLGWALCQLTDFALVPKLHLGMYLSAKLYFVRRPCSYGCLPEEVQLPGKGRSQVQLGNENRIAHGVRPRTFDYTEGGHCFHWAIFIPSFLRITIQSCASTQLLSIRTG